MMISCNDLLALTSGFSLVKSCDVIRNGMLRISTPFMYPNGSQIDLFFGNRRVTGTGSTHLTESPFLVDQQKDSLLVLSDLGQTSAYLFDVQVKINSTAHRVELVQGICEQLGIERLGSELFITVNEPEQHQLPHLITRLSQACIRVADLVYTHQERRIHSFKEDVESIISRRALTYRPNIYLPGRTGNRVRVDFEVMGNASTALVNTLATVNRGSAHSIANDTFVRWYDLGATNIERSERRYITVYDDHQNIFRRDDIERLAQISETFGLPKQEQKLQVALTQL